MYTFKLSNLSLTLEIKNLHSTVHIFTRKDLIKIIFFFASVVENSNNGESSCANDVANCADSPGRPVVEELAANNNLFTTEFITAFTKMIEKVCQYVLVSIYRNIHNRTMFLRSV